MREKILEKIIVNIQENFGFTEIINEKVFNEQNYEFLKGRHSARHIVLGKDNIQIIEYSKDPREEFYYTEKFEYIDEFLLTYFKNRLDLLTTILTGKAKGAMGTTYEKITDFMSYKKNLDHKVEVKLLSYIARPKFFILNLLLQLPIKRKQYQLLYTHITTFLGFFLLFIFFIFFFNDKSLPFLLWVAGFFFVSNSYLEIELLYREYRENKKIRWTNDRVLGVLGIIALFLYCLYFYKLI